MTTGRFFAITMALAILAIGCNNNHSVENKVPVASDSLVVSPGSTSKGIGRFKDIVLTHPLNDTMATIGETIFKAKCFACHKLTGEKLVGPGWKGVTDRRSPEWILNFISNTQVMLDKDLVAQSLLVTCLIRMPAQDLTDEQARNVYEFMRRNDGKN